MINNVFKNGDLLDPGYQVPLGALRALSGTRFRDDVIPG